MLYLHSKIDRPLNFYSSGNLISKENFLHEKRNFDIFVLILVKEGTLHISHDNKNFVVQKDQFILLHAHKDHYGFEQSNGKLSYLWIHFKFTSDITVTNNAISLDPENHYLIPEFGDISSNHRITLLLNQLLDISKQDFQLSKQMTDYSLSLVMMEITKDFYFHQGSTEKKIPPQVLQIIEWVRANYFLPLSVKQIANEFNYNQNYLSTLFKKSTGQTLIHFINSTRIEISKTILLNFDIPTKEIAYSCGFQDEKYYLKTFKQFEGITPSQFKKAFTEKKIISRSGTIKIGNQDIY